MGENGGWPAAIQACIHHISADHMPFFGVEWAERRLDQLRQETAVPKLSCCGCCFCRTDSVATCRFSFSFRAQIAQTREGELRKDAARGTIVTGKKASTQTDVSAPQNLSHCGLTRPDHIDKQACNGRDNQSRHLCTAGPAESASVITILSIGGEPQQSWGSLSSSSSTVRLLENVIQIMLIIL
jgi:hypothetical protein